MVMAYTSGNPVFQPKFWNTISGNDRMTFEGTLQKIGILFGLMTISALGTVVLGVVVPGLLMPMMMFGMFGTFGMGIYLMFSRPSNPQMIVMMYALMEGLFIGPLTLIFESMYPGIAIQAGLATLGVIGAMLTIYSLRIIRPTPTFNKIVFSLMISIMFVYLINFVLMLTPLNGVPFFHSSGPIGIAISVFIIVIASLMLISNFGMIEAGVRMGAPKQQEWWGAFGILVTVIWLYFEMLRLLAKLRDN
jgi:uncharacterized YccA/Bax inhibitor family protein|tara:strand:- start:5888 stop:6631 length:744 start_codon:yes stop_codon:yes gene_type:complete